MSDSSRRVQVVDAGASSGMVVGDCWQELLPRLAEDSGSLWTKVLLQCKRVLIYSRHHWLKYDGEDFDRQRFQATIEAVSEASPAEIVGRDAELVFCLYVLGCGNLGLEQVDEVLSMESVGRLVDSQQTQYAAAIGTAADVALGDLTLVERAYGLRSLRRAVEEDCYRYSVIDGERWFRSERLIPRDTIDLDQVPRRFLPGTDRDGASRKRLRDVAIDWIERAAPVEGLIVEIMRHALEDEELEIDHITLTAPRMLGPIPEENLHQRANIYRRTETREGLELGRFEAQLGHASDERLKRVIGARMQVLKLKAAKQFFGTGCLGGEALDKSGDYMIFFNEDAHYPGHRNAGCSTGGRAPIPLRLERCGQRFAFPGIFADLRVVRLSHDPGLRFTEEGLRRVIQYASWISVVLGAAYEAEVEIESNESSAAVSPSACPIELPDQTGGPR